MAKWTNYFKIVEPETPVVDITDGQNISGGAAHGTVQGGNSWYHVLVHGSASRLRRYREYDKMDTDVEISRALDTIAEEMTGNNMSYNMPLDVELSSSDQEDVPDNISMTIQTALRYWCGIHDWNNRLFDVARTLAKYGDCVFHKTDLLKKWTFVHPKNVIGAIVDAHDTTSIKGWQINTDNKKTQQTHGVPMAGSPNTNTEQVAAPDIVRYTLNSDMDDSAPFGESVLRSVYRAHMQKELLEDAIIIYRVQRAPERRVFYIDVDKMHPQRVKGYLEQVKNDIKQKKVPSRDGQVDSVYNPQSMSEDFFFASKSGGKGSRVETLPGGQGLGELSDLEYFQAKVFRGLRVPTSYMASGSESSVFNDGKVGVAYIEELRFSLYISRLQGHISSVMDVEFKKFLHASNIKVDHSLFKIVLPPPSNFGTYRQQEVDSGLLSSYSSADGVEYLSKRFILKKYLQLSNEEVVENERLLAEELGVSGDTPDKVKQLYGSPGDMSPADDMVPDMGGDLPDAPQDGDTTTDL